MWMATFADLMSLLMCFFVLLLSFAEMDVMKFKQIAASMSEAFGVQRDVFAAEVPMGTSVIAQEFSPGTPTDTVTDDVRQQTSDEQKQTLEFTDAVGGEDESEGRETAGGETAAEREAREKTEEEAKKLLNALRDEIEDGRIEVEAKGNSIIVRIREKGSFPSGTDRLRKGFMPVVDKLKNALAETDGEIVVAGHTDDIPIKTSRFRSNWDLSAARAVTVVHELTTKGGGLDPKRFVVEGRGDTVPLAPNDSSANRALNRRVELTIIQNPLASQARTDSVITIQTDDGAGLGVKDASGLSQARDAVNQAAAAKDGEGKPARPDSG